MSRLFSSSSMEEIAPFWIPGPDSASASPPVAVFFRVHKSCLWDIILNLVAISSAHCTALPSQPTPFAATTPYSTPIHSCLSGGLILFHFRGFLLFIVPRELGRPDGRAAGTETAEEARVLRRSLNVIYCLRMVQTSSGIWKGIGCVNFRFYLPLGHNGRKQNIWKGE